MIAYGEYSTICNEATSKFNANSPKKKNYNNVIYYLRININDLLTLMKITKERFKDR